MLYKMIKGGGSLTFTEVGYDVEALCIGLLEALEDAQRLLWSFRLGLIKLHDDALERRVDERRDTIAALIDHANKAIYPSKEERNANLPTLQ